MDQGWEVGNNSIDFKKAPFKLASVTNILLLPLRQGGGRIFSLGYGKFFKAVYNL